MIDSYTMECNMGLHEFKSNADRIRSVTEKKSMNGDLISKSELLESLINCKELGRKSFAAVIDVINEQPTYKETKHGHWFLLDDCSNEGVYCSVCHKKVYKKDYNYANVKLKSKFCPNCGAIMDGEFKKL